ncbi:hypothetical protein [Halosimplex pelagicum]|uniref:Uncharacterized protein n=1 Tax=Halosimplex pelagicum TaxID=869886 RepID=A0A7D5TQ23_9EURY|nr:hypothetical protein [Halosimplex pelagicum]QLH80152.1 hypothetical protein HZS54_00275 [Halosimplex pelagicum]
MRRTTTLSQDERAIEGLPIRLVIALVVGVASLAIMMQMIGGLGFETKKEVDVEITSDSIATTGGSAVTLDVVTEEGDPVRNAQVLIESGTLTVDNGPVQMYPDGGSSPGPSADDGKMETSAAICAASSTGCSASSGKPVVNFRSDQDKGTITFDIVLQGDGNYKDEEPNRELVVTR